MILKAGGNTCRDPDSSGRPVFLFEDDLIKFEFGRAIIAARGCHVIELLKRPSWLEVLDSDLNLS